MATHKKKNLSKEDSNKLLSDLIDGSSMVDGERLLARTTVQNAAKKFKLSERHVRRLWQKAKKNRADIGYCTCESAIKDNSGRRRVYNRDDLLEAMEEVPHEQRGNMRGLASRLGVSHMTIHRMIRQEKVIHPHSAALKPFLTAEQRMERIAYCADRLEKVGETYFYKPWRSCGSTPEISTMCLGPLDSSEITLTS